MWLYTKMLMNFQRLKAKVCTFSKKTKMDECECLADDPKNIINNTDMKGKSEKWFNAFNVEILWMGKNIRFLAFHTE
jgi:hypothetical protein